MSPLSATRAAIRRIAMLLGIAAIAQALGACSAFRTVEIHQPLSVRPAAPATGGGSNGAIFQAANTQATGYMPLFEDRRARNIGDSLIVNINEKINASKAAATTANRAGATTFDVPTVTGVPLKGLQGASLAATSKNDFSGKGDSTANNVFTGTIAVTVIEVLPNGYLVVSGEKQIGINQGSEFIRLSGIVDPIHIVFGNVVSSTQIADARLEYRGTGYIDEAQTMGWAARIFQSILPF